MVRGDFVHNYHVICEISDSVYHCRVCMLQWSGVVRQTARKEWSSRAEPKECKVFNIHCYCSFFMYLCLMLMLMLNAVSVLMYAAT